MRNFAGHLAVAAGLAFLATLTSGCRSTSWDRQFSSISLRIGIVEDSPPLAFRQKRQWTGIEADLGRALAARLDMKPVFVACPLSRLPAALLAGEVDVVMAGLTISEERRVQMDFSMPYLVVGQAALIRAPDLLRFNTESRIRSAHARIGVVEGGAGDGWVSRYFTNASRVAFPHAEDGTEALLRGDIDLLIHDAPSVWWIALHHPEALAIAPPLFAREEIAWGFRRGSVALREAANRALADWQKDGTLESILRRWIPVSQ